MRTVIEPLTAWLQAKITLEITSLLLVGLFRMKIGGKILGLQGMQGFVASPWHPQQRDNFTTTATN